METGWSAGSVDWPVQRPMSTKKRVFEVLFFLAVMALTFTAVFKGQDMGKMLDAVLKMDPLYLTAAFLLGVLFICLEGFMIWDLLSALDGKSSLLQCVSYSFVGFFYSGITPSATGGQPMQLYYMTKDGNRATDSTVVLMTVALCYKLVLVCIGLGILAGWGGPLRLYLKGYFGFYLLGLFLNTVLVILILLVMLFPGIILRTSGWGEALLVRLGLFKTSGQRMEKVQHFVDQYRQAVQFLKEHKGKLAEIVGLTFLQRSTLFVLTWMVYLGFGLTGTKGMTVMLLQAAVYIAVDMLPVPGAQGITELMYKTVFAAVFTKGFLIPSMLVSRSVNFYFLLLVSLGFAAAASVLSKKVPYRQKINKGDFS